MPPARKIKKESEWGELGGSTWGCNGMGRDGARAGRVPGHRTGLGWERPLAPASRKEICVSFFTCICTSSVLTLGLLRPVAGTGGQSEMLSTQRDEAHSSLC